MPRISRRPRSDVLHGGRGETGDVQRHGPAWRVARSATWQVPAHHEADDFKAHLGHLPVAMRRPSRNTLMRSAMRRISSRRCEM
jgi:hypothetical protein